MVSIFKLPQTPDNDANSAQPVLDISSIQDAPTNTPDLPSPKEIMRRITEGSVASVETGEVKSDSSATSGTQGLLDKVQHVILVQTDNLPDEVRKAVEKLKESRREHPYIYTGASLIVFVAASEFIVPPLLLGALKVVGFSEAGPVAGSLASLVQGKYYGAYTQGVFSVFQRAGMLGKAGKGLRLVTSFCDLVGAGAVARLIRQSGTSDSKEVERAQVSNLNDPNPEDHGSQAPSESDVNSLGELGGGTLDPEEEVNH